ncbi:AraC family transcriptional regulator [Sphingomonas sp. PAMC26645]|nr:AraC family transcriptional regulator [Sphingomonas sp. PAMC26645]
MLGKCVASLADVAQLAGFVNQSHLTRTFQSRLDITPAYWGKSRYVELIQDANAAMWQVLAVSLQETGL